MKWNIEKIFFVTLWYSSLIKLKSVKLSLLLTIVTWVINLNITNYIFHLTLKEICKDIWKVIFTYQHKYQLSIVTTAYSSFEPFLFFMTPDLMIDPNHS